MPLKTIALAFVMELNKSVKEHGDFTTPIAVALPGLLSSPQTPEGASYLGQDDGSELF